MVRLMAVAALIVAVPAGAETPKRDAVEKSADAQSKTICKRFTETGSLVRGYRVCKPKADWDRDRDNIRAPSPTSNGCNGPACN